MPPWRRPFCFAVRTLLLYALGDGLIGMTLHFDYEVRPARDAFDNVPALKVEGEMLELAEHIIRTKQGTFDPARFDDRYEAALADLVKAKMEGKKIEARQEKKPEKVVDLMAALRESAGMTGKKPTAKPRSAGTRAKRAAPRRKAS